MDKLNTAIENVKQRFADMRKALIHYNHLKQEEKLRLRSTLRSEEWPDVKSRMKDWLNITQDLIDLPPEAQNEKNYYVNEGTKSAIRIPMIVEGRMLGALMFDSCRSEKAWPDDLVQQLQLIGQTFSYSLERKLAEEALRDSEDKLRAIFENVNDGIIFLDNQGTIIDTNKEVDIFGFRREEVIGKNFAEFEFYRPDSFENLMERFSEIFTGSHSNLIELEGKRRNGVEIIFEVSTNLIEKDGEVKKHSCCHKRYY